MTTAQVLILVSFATLILTLTKRMPGFALTRPVALMMSLAAISLGGIVAFWALPVELMPNNSFGIISVTTMVRGGMSPTEIERQITKPIEEAGSSVEHIRSVISNSTAGKSVVSIEFEPGTDMDFATLDVREKFSRVRGDLPREIENPIIAHYRESDVPIHIFAFTSSKQSPEELRQLVDRELKEKLMRVKGVANADVAGGRERKIVINVDRHRLAAAGLDIRRLVRELEESNLNIKTGEVKTASSDTSIRAMGQFESVEEVANTVIGVTPQGTSLYLKDVSDVRDSFLEQESLARLNGSSAVTVYVQKDSVANTVQVVEKTSEVLAAFKKNMPADIALVEISNQADAIKEAVNSVKHALFIGIFLIVVILGYILGLVPALIVAASIPLTTLMVGCLLYFENLSINVMTLSGLALGIGLLVDNSIVVLETILRQKAVTPAKAGVQPSNLDPGFRRDDIAQAASGVSSAIMGGTLTTIVVFIPFFLLSKQLQLLYSGLAITITTALLSSLFIALTTVPYFTKRFVLSKDKDRHADEVRHSRESGNPGIQHFFKGKLKTWIPAFAGMTGPFLGTAARFRTTLPNATHLIDKLKDGYTRVLPHVIEKRNRLFGAALVLFLGAIYIFQFHIEKNLSEGEESNEFVVFVELPSGKRLDISDSIVKEVEEKIRAYEPTASSIKSITTRVDGWSSKIYVGLVPPEKRKLGTQDVIDRLRPLLTDIGKNEEAFVYFSASQSGQELTVNIYGEEEKMTSDYAMQVAGLFEKAPGFTDTKIRYRPGRPEVKIIVDPARAALFGLNPTEVGNILHAQTRGLRATYFRQAGQEVETVVRLKVDQTNSLQAIRTLLIPTPQGTQVPLEQIARFDYSLAPSEIWRNNKQRMIQVSSNISKRSLERAATEAKKLLTQIPFTTDYSAEIGGDYKDRLQAQTDFKNAIILTCLLIFAVLACLFESLLQPLLLFVSVPLAAIGIVTALLVTGTSVTLGVEIGILMTGGIVVNNAILFIDHFNARKRHTAVIPAKAGIQASNLQSETTGSPIETFGDDDAADGVPDDAAADDDLIADLVEAGRDRLRPILLTTLTTILGLFPMAIDHSSGAELWRPMAIATIGGLMSSMVLTLLVLPALIYSIEMRRHAKLASSPHVVSRDPAVIPAKAGIQVLNPLLKKVESLDSRFRGNDDPLRSESVLLVFLFLALAPGFAWAQSALPPWVDQFVIRRVNDLMAEAKRYERKKDYSQAIQLNLEAVRLAPGNEKARENLLRVNAKGFEAGKAVLEKKRRSYVSAAWDDHRAKKAWRDALEGKMKEAERHAHQGRFAVACDRYYQILDENPSYLPAVKGLDQLQTQLAEKLEKGGAFESEASRQVAQGFWFYNQEKWAEASQVWSPVLGDPVQAKKWGPVRLGVYMARAIQNHERDERRKKIESGVSAGLENFRNGNLKDAELSFQDVLALDPSHNQAKEYARLIPGLKERVRADVLTEVREQEIARTLSDAVEFYLKGFYDEAEAKVQLVLKETPDHPQALSVASDIRKARGLPLIPTLEEKATEEQLKIESLYSNGIIAFAEGRFKDAETAWQEVLKSDSTHARAQQALKKLSEEK